MHERADKVREQRRMFTIDYLLTLGERAEDAATVRPLAKYEYAIVLHLVARIRRASLLRNSCREGGCQDSENSCWLC